MYLENGSFKEVYASMKPDVLNFVLIGEKNDIDIHRMVDACNKDGYQIAGGIFPMVLSGNGYSDNGIIIKCLKVSEKPAFTHGLDTKDFEPNLPEGQGMISSIILVDGLTKNIGKFLEGIYDKFWNNVEYLGGGCGSLSLQSTPCVFSNEGLFQDSGLIIPLKQKQRVGIRHGWEKIDGPFIANSVEGTVIKELNWKPSLDVYKEVLQGDGVREEITPDNFFDISKGYPFGVTREGLEDIVRDPIIMNEANELVCVGEVANNTAVNILKGDNDNLIESAGHAAEYAASDSDFQSIIVIDCISRVLYLEDDFRNELARIMEAVRKKNPDVVAEGALTIGEISAYPDGFLEFFNKTIVVSAISE